jgi:hypothetical protein
MESLESPSEFSPFSIVFLKLRDESWVYFVTFKQPANRRRNFDNFRCFSTAISRRSASWIPPRFNDGQAHSQPTLPQNHPRNQTLHLKTHDTQRDSH